MFTLRSFARCSAALSAAVVIAVAPFADARWMAHFDLTGLVLSSEAVVHATRVSTGRPTPDQQLDRPPSSFSSARRKAEACSRAERRP